MLVHDGGGSAIEIAFCRWCGASPPQWTIDEKKRG
ncbi:hypothetical protein [Sphingomonas sp. PP-F2F-G114-C0414]